MGMINNDVHKPLDAVKLANYAIGNDLVFINRSLGANNAWVAKADTLSSLARSKYNIFALIIGVDKYASLIYKNLDGASSDADRFEAYLLEDLRTPKEHIISFRDGQATRSAIIDELINMKYNSDIQPNTTAIVIYFAGYGAITTKPVEWIDWKTPYNHIGMLCPTDIGILDENGDVIHGIPDRTINQLLLELSSVKGNNITLILDCCYAVDSSDQPKPADMPTAKPRQIFNPPKLLSNCDQKIYSRAEKSVARFGSSHSDSHILLTACKHYQSAYESQGEGLFTRALLKVLREWPKGELTYKSLIHHLDTPACQTPLLEGNRIDRYLFDSGDTVNGCRILCYSEKDQPYLSLHAGSLHGIRAGSIFKIYRTDLSDGRRRLTVATAVKVEAFVSFLKPADQFILTAYGNHRVWYAQFVGVSAPRFTIYCNDSNFLARILDEEVGSRLVDPPSPVDDLQQADLCLTVDGNSVLFDRGNRTSIVSPIMGLPSRFSHISTVDTVSQIRNIIECYACFTSRITMSNRLPISRLVSVEMRVILDLQPRSNNLLPDAIDKPIEPIELVSDSSDFYGFITVYNTSDIDLYVSLCHFDASTLAIDMPQAFTRLTSRKTSVTYCNKKFRLNIPEDQDVNVHFLKLFVAKRCIVIDGFCQPSPFSGVPVKHGAGVPLISNSEEWASMIISVVVRRPKLDSTQKLSSYLDEKLGKGIFPTKRGKEGRKEGSFIT